MLPATYYLRLLTIQFVGKCTLLNQLQMYSLLRHLFCIFFGGVLVAFNSVFYDVSFVLLFVCFSLFFLTMVLLVYFRLFEFYCTSGIYRPSFVTVPTLEGFVFNINRRLKRTEKVATVII